jgi:hypothetical protein
MTNDSPTTNRFAVFAWRVIAAHMVSYFLAGLVAYKFLDYQHLFETPPYSSFMKPMNSSAVAAGPALQLIRGLIFSLVLWPFRSAFLNTRYGWLKLWALLVGLCTLSTTAAAPGSIEGYIYTSIPVNKQVWGYLEVVPQTLLFSLIVYYWYKYPRKSWTIISAILVVIIGLISVLAVVMAR